MIIGLFNDSYPPVVDGVARVVLNYASELRALGHKCYVITPNLPGTEDAYKTDLLTFQSFPAPKRNEYRWGVGKADAKFWKNIKDIPFDILHTHSPFSAHMVAQALSNRNGTPIVTTFHTKYRDDFQQVMKSKVLVDSLIIRNVVNAYNKADEVWTVNQASIDTLRDYGYQGNIHIMPNGCDITPSDPTEENRQEILRQYGFSDAPLLMYIGQHTEQKNLPMLMKALTILSEKECPFNMLFVGDGALRESLQTQVSELGLSERIKFAGIIRDREQVKKIYLASYAMLFPSLYDTSSLVPREAAACKCPAVLIEGSSTAEGISDNQNGFLAANDPELYAVRLEAILKDRDMHDAVAEHALRSLYRPWSAAVSLACERYQYIISQKKKSQQEN